MQEKVSVIVPIYNVEKYVKKCINSVLEQTYKKLEIIYRTQVLGKEGLQ